MNEDIATLVATTPEQRRAQLTNIALNEFDAAMHQALVGHPIGEGVTPTPVLVKALVRQRATGMYRAVCRVAVQLARIYGEES